MDSQLLRVGQLNLQGSSTATTELVIISRELGLDVILVQEQSNQPGIIQKGANSKAGILVVNKDLGVTYLDHLSTDHCVVANVGSLCADQDLFVVSLYCQYSHDIAIHLEQLTRVLDHLSGKRVLICMDSNAHSPLWHCERRQYVGRGPDTDYRKNQMEGLIMSRGLLIHNVEGQPPTFHGPNGQSNVDLTLTTRGVTVSGWRVLEGASISDHQLITFEISGGGSAHTVRTGSHAVSTAVLYRERGVDWDRFRAALHNRMGNLNTSRPANDICKQYTKILIRTAEDHLGKVTNKTKGPKGYEWWTPELTCLRRTLYIARRSWQHSRKIGSPTAEAMHNALRAVRCRYKAAMREAELNYFRGVAESGNTDPWGIAYRVATGRIRPPTANIMQGISLLEGYTESIGDTMEGLLRALCPDDDPSGDSSYHRQVRTAADWPPSGTNSGKS